MASPTPMDEDKAPEKMSQEAYFDTAIRAVRQKKPAPEIDFTLHTMEDGTQVSTTERVCKGMCLSAFTAH
jgi:serine/threonine-protein phosphatase 2B catalytic subunit